MTEENKIETTKAAEPSVKSTKKRWPIVVGIIVVVLLAAGIGGYAWHNTPGFCGTACHDTMSEHVANYYGTDASNGAGLASYHATVKVTCLDCHKATLDTQMAELQTQLSGKVTNLGLADRYYVDNGTCLSCHGGSYDSLAQQTASLGAYNPHESPHGQLNCNECHKGHESQVDTCGQCHPNGGQTMQGN